MVSAGIIGLIEDRLSIKIAGCIPISGGDINAVYCLQTASCKYLLKMNSAGKYLDMFSREKEGLLAMAATQTVGIPKVYLSGETAGQIILLMEWIESKRPTTVGLANLGRKLAGMHRHTSGAFGFEHDNYIGSLHQSNMGHDTWHEFYVKKRLEPLVDLAREKELLDIRDVNCLQRLYAQLPELFKAEQPALIHGDLWSGNYLIDVNDEPYLIDPAVYYGHREMDIALSTLFGGFGTAFYKAYHKAYPLKAGWEQRLGLWNLYPLLVHINLFGGGYVQQFRATLGKIINC